MTGFEAWVRAGLELGAREVLAAEIEVEVERIEYQAEPYTLEERTRLVAERLMQRWPPWKVSKSKQTELPLDCNECACCHTLYNPDQRMYDTPHGLLCPKCMHLYIDRKWPEETA